jgi:hypothetical protein
MMVNIIVLNTQDNHNIFIQIDSFALINGTKLRSYKINVVSLKQDRKTKLFSPDYFLLYSFHYKYFV